VAASPKHLKSHPPEKRGEEMFRTRLLSIAPAFFTTHEFYEKSQGYFPESGPWGTGLLKLVEGGLRFGLPPKRTVLEAFDRYWDRRYPRLQNVIFENELIADREEAMRLCRETEGAVDIVSFIRPLDTLKVAESRFGKMIKSRQAAATDLK
jgi:hypothetical protein